MTKDNFDIEYNKWLRQVEVSEESAVWERIEDELDFMETWDNISGHLDAVAPQKERIVPMRFVKILSAVAAVLLLLLLPVKHLLNEDIHPIVSSEQLVEMGEEKPSGSETVILSQTDKTEIGDSEREEPVDLTISILTLAYTIDIDDNTKEIEGAVDFNTIVIDEISEIDAVEKISSLPFNSNLYLASNHIVVPEFFQTPIPINSEPEKSSGFHFRVLDVGLVYGYKNTWLLNYETYNGFNPTKLGNTLPTFHQDIGASSTFQFNNKYKVGVEFLWRSEVGQNYQQYINASFIDRSINLTYSKLQAFYHWNGKKFRGEAVFGGYLARLSMAEEIHEETRFIVDNNYTNMDYGLVAGYQYSIALGNAIVLKPGVRVNFNLINIFKGDDMMPSRFKRTNNLAASFNISLSYRFFR